MEQRDINIKVTDADRLMPISQASVWHYPVEEENKPKLLGFTDLLGEIVVKADPFRVRIVARGCIPADSVILARDLHFRLNRNHPAAYSGFLPEAENAVWRKKGSEGPVFQFGAFGLMREAENLSDLLSAPFKQYRMRNRLSWTFGAEKPGTINDLSYVENNSAASLEWSDLGRRAHIFPQTENFIYTLGPYALFRFPVPGQMIARASQSLAETEFELVG